METYIALLSVILVVLVLLLIKLYRKSSEQKTVLDRINNKLDLLSTQLHNKTQVQETAEEKIIVQEEVIITRRSTEPKPVEITLEQTISTKATFEFPQTRKRPRQKKNSDLERFIGENLANKIGIAILVLGISFFVKYAIDKNWINETGRVMIGFLCGAVLIAIAHYIRKNYRPFSSVLVGGGLSVFYFTTAYAFHQYHLISQQTAFIIMMLISICAVLLSIFYDRKEISILATIGGFITPFLVTTGQENYIALFSYLCILNAGMMALAWFKRWVEINIISLFFTTLIYYGWLIRRSILGDIETFPFADAFLFATVFYLIFIAMNVSNNIRFRKKFEGFDFIIVLSVNFLYYLASLFIFTNLKAENLTSINYSGIFTGALGLFNLILVGIFYRLKNIDRHFVSLLLSVAITFISLVAPIEFRGSHIVLFWAAESVALLWLYQRTNITNLKYASFVVVILMTASLIVTWWQVYYDTQSLPLIVNKGFTTSLIAAISLFVFYWLLRNEKTSFLKNISLIGARNVFMTTAVTIAYLGGAFEINHQFGHRYPGMSLNIVYFQLYSFTVALLVLQIFRRSSYIDLLHLLLVGLSVAIYLVNIPENRDAAVALLSQGKTYLFAGHWAAAILLFVLLVKLIQFFFRKTSPIWIRYQVVFTWMTAICITLLMSVELYHIILWVQYGKSDWEWWENLYYKAGLTILWGLCSFTMIWLGMKFHFRALRIISLSLFTFTLIKLFTFDIRNIPPGGKIAAFILLGILLLTISFMYQRLKKIIIDNTAE